MKKKKLQVLDTIKFIDIDKYAIDRATWHFLMNYYIVYDDRILWEPLIGIGNAAEKVNDKDIKKVIGYYHKKVVAEVKKLSKLANKHDAAYIRFITP